MNFQIKFGGMRMVRAVWHKVSSGSFEKDGQKHDYVVEQNKNLPVKNNTRLRIIKTKPEVKAIRTRYEPHIEIDGEQDAYVPCYFGYNPKQLRSIIPFLMVGFISVWSTFQLLLGIDIVSSIIPSGVNLGIPFNPIISYLLRIVLLALILFYLCLPVMVRTFEKFKLYFLLKRKGLKYSEVHNESQP